MKECETCQFYDRIEAKTEYCASYGMCRVDPPRTDDRWPKVRGNDWCGAWGERVGEPSLTKRAARVMAMAREEAAVLGHREIGTQHLLLGILREGEGIAMQVLMNAMDRVPDADAVREEVRSIVKP